MLLVWFVRCGLTVAVLAVVYAVVVSMRSPSKKSEFAEKFDREAGGEDARAERERYVRRRVRGWRLRVAAAIFGAPLLFVGMLVWLANV